MAEITDSKGAKHTLTFDHQIGTGLEGAVYSATLDGAPIAAKKLNLKNPTLIILDFLLDLTKLSYQLSIEIELVNNLGVCRESLGITCFRGIVANEAHINVIKSNIYVINPKLDISPLLYINNSSEDIYLLYELLEGKELLDYIITGIEKPEQKLKPEQKISIIKQLLTILDRLHGNDIIHGDIKAENLFYNGADQLKLFDFGFTCKKTQCTTFRGTPGFISPERLVEGPLVDSTKMDIFAAGQLMYVLCAECNYIQFIAGVNQNDRQYLTKIKAATKNIDFYLQYPQMRTTFLSFNEFHEDLYDKLFLPMIRQDPTKRPSASEALAILEGLERAGTLYKAAAADKEPPSGGKRSTRRQNKKRRSKKAA